MYILTFLLVFLLLIVLGSLTMCGWYKATRKGMVFGRWSGFWEEKAGDKYVHPEWLVHPLSGCVYCYASFYGSLFFWLVGGSLVQLSGAELQMAFGDGFALFVLWAVYVLSTCAMNGILIKKVL